MEHDLKGDTTKAFYVHLIHTVSPNWSCNLATFACPNLHIQFPAKILYKCMVQFLSDRMLQVQSKLNGLQIMKTDYAFMNFYNIIVRILLKMSSFKKKIDSKQVNYYIHFKVKYFRQFMNIRNTAFQKVRIFILSWSKLRFNIFSLTSLIPRLLLKQMGEQ